ncbi:MAG TPA: hypothetical protein VEO95_03245 [Chthoniobacteraceae bacterium]|nr:hypothetical protein [Chthoniobacteraceae bacterium]
MKLKIVLALLALASPALAQKAASLNDTARFLAGLPTSPALDSLTKNGVWQSHATAMDQAWAKKETAQVGPIRSWMSTYAPGPYRSGATCYYMFSGPDALYANTFFPNARTYILAGLEPVGQVGEIGHLSPEQLRGELSALRSSMSTILSFHYFITKDMRTGLGAGQINGTLPILYVFLSRLGNTILDTQFVSSPAPGVKITFTRGGGAQTLYYFKTDLSGGGSGFLKWCAGQGPGNSLLKAASYLMHTDGFSGVRNFLLNNSRVIVQDDSGIPLHAFDKRWVVQCYGRYVPHAEMFGKYHQSDLAAIFEKQQPPELGFAFGYHWQKDRGILMLATRD